jgi:chemotaxis signal transduction protein
LDRLECLECLMGGKRMLVPMQHLDRVVEFPLTPPPPLVESWVAGLGVLGDSHLVVLALPGAPRGPLDSCKAVLLRAPRSGSRFAVEVEDVRAIWSINPDAFTPAADVGWPSPSSWLTAASDGNEHVLCLDTEAVAAWLFAGESTSSTTSLEA